MTTVLTSATVLTSTLHSERIKFTSIRSPLWTALAAAVLSLAVAVLQGATAYGAAGIRPQQAAMGVAVFAVPLLMVVSALTVTGEYRSGTIRSTFAATPQRAVVVAAKAIVAASFSAVVTAATTVACIAVARVAADPLVGAGLSLALPATWRLVVALAVYAAVAAVLGVAVGVLLRHAAGAVAVLLLWPLVIEPILGNLPNLGPRVGPFLPFLNAFVFTDVQWLYPTYPMPWGPFASLIYFAVVVGVVLAAATASVHRRDA